MMGEKVLTLGERQGRFLRGSQNPAAEPTSFLEATGLDSGLRSPSRGEGRRQAPGCPNAGQADQVTDMETSPAPAEGVRPPRIPWARAEPALGGS